MPLLNENSDKDLKTQEAWFAVRRFVKNQFGKRPDINAILFLVGMNELGQFRENWSKEDKQNLMHIAICKLFEEDGYYKLIKIDEEGWPHYNNVKELPNIHLKKQEGLLKKKIVAYFEAKKYI